MAWKILLAALGAALALYLGGLWLAARSKRPVGPRPETAPPTDGYRAAAPVVVEASGHFVGTMAGGVLFEHPGPSDGCPICRSLSAWDAQHTERPCSLREGTHDGTPVEKIYAARGPR